MERRSPQGGRGLKLDVATSELNAARSLSARRAWIETGIRCDAEGAMASLSARRAWIETPGKRRGRKDLESLSARRAWIETR